MLLAQENELKQIVLPKIPVTWDAQSELFRKANSEKAFFTYTATPVSTQYGLPLWKRWLYSIPFGVIGYFIANSAPSSYGAKKLDCIGVGALATLGAASGFAITKKNTVYDLNATDGINSYSVNFNEYTIGDKLTDKFSNYLWYAPALYFPLVAPPFLLGMEALATNKWELYLSLNGYNIETPVPYTFSEESFSDLESEIIGESKPVKKLSKLYEKLKQATIAPDLTSINSKKYTQLSKLNQPRGEFETSDEYNLRLQKEGYEKQTIEADYQQEKRKIISEYNNKWYKPFRQIEEECKGIILSKEIPCRFSLYDADRQSFDVKISGEYSPRTLRIPRDEAKKFKDNIANLCVIKRFRPTTDGRWEAVDKDFALYDTKNETELSWMGKPIDVAEKVTTIPPSLTASFQLIDPNGNNFLDAEEKAKLQITLKNDGQGPASNLQVSLEQTKGEPLYYDVLSSIPTIEPGQSKSVQFEISVPYKVISGDAAFKVSFLEIHGYEPQPMSINLSTRAAQPPVLAIADYGVNDAAGLGKISRGGSADITIRIQNKGQGIAKNASIELLENIGQNLFLDPNSQKSFKLGDLNPSESRDIKFSVLTNNRVGAKAGITVLLNESREENSKKEVFTLDIEQPQKKLEPIIVTGKENYVDIEKVNNLSIDIEKDIPKTTKANAGAVAVIIGIRDYASGDIPKVEYAKRDALLMREYLISTLGYDPKNILPQNPDELMTVGNLKNLMRQKLPSYLKPDGKSDIFIYYAGHGAPSTASSQPFFVPYDCDPNYVSDDNAYKMSDFYADIAKVKARNKTIVIDACFSGQSGDGKAIVKNASPVLLKVDNPLFASKDAVIFQSSEANQVSNWYPEKKHGMFTYFFLKGLKGEADLDNDGKITVGELENFINDENNNLPYVSQREMQRKQKAVIVGEREKVISGR